MLHDDFESATDATCSGCVGVDPCEGCAQDPISHSTRWGARISDAKGNQTEFWRTAEIAHAARAEVAPRSSEPSGAAAVLERRRRYVSSRAFETGSHGWAPSLPEPLTVEIVRFVEHVTAISGEGGSVEKKRWDILDEFNSFLSRLPQEERDSVFIQRLVALATRGKGGESTQAPTADGLLARIIRV